ncbi:MAG: glycosyltransferase family 2 protein [Planctomycetota bacterium]
MAEDSPHPDSAVAAPDMAAIDVSVVAPAHNEAGNVEPLVQEVEKALAGTGRSFEFVIVDDGSTDRTREEISELMSARPWLRCVAMQNTPPGSGNGQSAAFHAGFRACRGALIAVLDADLQNDPGDIPAMLQLMERESADLVQGDRSHARKDNFVKRRASEVGRLFRRVLLRDRVRDTGCSLRVMRREVALGLPLRFKGMHRFIPVTARDLGFKVVEMPVTHRARHAGETKYGRLGITKRAIPGLIDCFAVIWMRSRRRPVESVEVGRKETDAA